MLPEDFRREQVALIDTSLTETRQEIEALMQREEHLLEQKEKWLGKIAADKFEPFLIGLPSLYVPEQRDGGGAA